MFYGNFLKKKISDVTVLYLCAAFIVGLDGLALFSVRT